MPDFPKPGEIFCERYKVLELLGVGGVGSVFKAIQIEYNREIALKILNPDLANDDEFRERFVREARVMHKLNHKNIVTVYHVGVSEDGFTYIAMELLHGRSLRNILAKEGRLDSLRAISIIQQVAAALACAHVERIVHRDLKPENIICVDQPEPDTVKLIDFGLAKMKNEQKLTGTGMLIGTVSYMSPEQCKGQVVDIYSDIYSLCICLFELFTGGLPFYADNPVGTMYKHLNDPIPTIDREHMDRFDEKINAFFERGLAKLPEKRFASMDELRESLNELALVLKTISPVASQVQNFGMANSKKRSLLPLGVSAAIALIALLGFALIKKTVTPSAVLVSKKDLQDPSKIRRITFSGAQVILANAFLKPFPEGKKIIDQYLKGNNLETKARCLMLIYVSKHSTDPHEKLTFAKEATQVSLNSWRKTKDSKALEFYLGCGATYVSKLIDLQEYSTALNVLPGLITACEALPDMPSATIGEGVYLPNLAELIIFQAYAAMKTNDRKLASKLLDKIVDLDYGGFHKATYTTELLLSFNRMKDLDAFIHTLSDPYENAEESSGLYSYNLNRNFDALIEVARACVHASRFDFAKVCLHRAEIIDKYSEAQTFYYRPSSGVITAVTRAWLAAAQGQNEFAKSTISKLAKDWLAANGDNEVNQRRLFKRSDPTPMIAFLYFYGFDDKAAQILKIIGKDPSRYFENIRNAKSRLVLLNSNQEVLIKLSESKERKAVIELAETYRILLTRAIP